MQILLAVNLTDSQVKKIGGSMGNFGDEIIDQTECKDWLEVTLQEKFDEMPLPPE